VKKIGCAQAGETGTDYHNGLVGGIERTRGDASNGGRGERKPARRLLKKSSAIHVLLFVR